MQWGPLGIRASDGQVVVVALLLLLLLSPATAEVSMTAAAAAASAAHTNVPAGTATSTVVLGIAKPQHQMRPGSQSRRQQLLPQPPWQLPVVTEPSRGSPSTAMRHLLATELSEPSPTPW